MKPGFLLICTLLLVSLTASANHITGGEMSYRLMGVSGNTYTYSVRLKLYQRCNSGRNFPNPAIISVFDRNSDVRFQDLRVPQSATERIRITNPDPCISSPPDVCFEISYYDFELVLNGNPNGYVIASMVNFRIENITNLAPSGRIGALYTAEIPGTAAHPSGPTNNSARFTGSDLVIICAGNRFAYSFGAEDQDGDSLRYSFCGAYNSTSLDGGGAVVFPPDPPPYSELFYAPSFGPTIPLGTAVKIDSQTGLITGIAPGAGIYVVTVCVEEIRNGKVIASQRKDVQINVANCGITEASLADYYQLCDTSMTLQAANLSTSSKVNTYKWQLLDRHQRQLVLTNTPTFSHTFSDTGLYYLRLTINENEACTDSALAPVRVYPGFRPGFAFMGLCTNATTVFTDATTTRYGVVNSWRWHFVDDEKEDSSFLQNPTYKFNAPGNKQAALEVTNSVGCIGIVSHTLPISDKPPLFLNVTDTLICKGDTLQLSSAASGTVAWTPANRLSPATGPVTHAYPDVTTTYYATLKDHNCQNLDSVLVRVITKVSLKAMPDTTICQGDLIRLRLASDGLRYQWKPGLNMADASAPQPLVALQNSTLFTVRASVGRCSAEDSVAVTVVPYPRVFAGKDTTICFGTTAQLRGATDGYSVQWSPANNINHPFLLDATAKPAATTSYILSAYDNRGCPKPSHDTIVVTVLPKINALANRDTNIVVGQLLQLQASGGAAYLWQPRDHLSNPAIPDPIARFDLPVDFIRYKVSVFSREGCADSASFTVRVFRKGTHVFVPTGFTPNGDGNNDVLRPTLAGISKLAYFRVYNRLGEMVFYTSEQGKGWDGRLKGQMQPASAYIWMIQVVLADNTVYNDKGTCVLVR